MNCDKCMHSKVCIYEENARNMEQEVKDYISSKEYDTSVVIPSFRCLKFRIKYGKKEDGIKL